MHRLTAHHVPVAPEMHQLGKGIALRAAAIYLLFSTAQGKVQNRLERYFRRYE